MRNFDKVVQALAKGIESQGHDVRVLNAQTDTGQSLTPYSYIAVGTCTPSFFAKKIPEPLGAFLRSAGHLSGKRSYAFTGKSGLRKGRVLASLMKTMESEGMFLKRSDVLSSPAEAEAVGSRLHVERTAT